VLERDALRPGVDREAALRGAIDSVDAVVLVVGPDWLSTDGGASRLEDPHDPVRVALEQALASGTRLIPVLVEKGKMPVDGELPSTVEPIAGLQPVTLTDQYWDGDVEHLVSILRRQGSSATRRPLDIGAWWRQLSRVWKGVTAVLPVIGGGGVIGLLVLFGVIGGHHEREQGDVGSRIGVGQGVTLDSFLTRHPDAADDYREPRRTNGLELRATVGLQNPKGSDYTLRWTLVNASDGNEIEPFVNRIGSRFGSEQAAGVHAVWAPCPPGQGIRFFRVVLSLVDEERPTVPLDEQPTERQHCEYVEG
jgi:hypothetical protein